MNCSECKAEVTMTTTCFTCDISGLCEECGRKHIGRMHNVSVWSDQIREENMRHYAHSRGFLL